MYSYYVNIMSHIQHCFNLKQNIVLIYLMSCSDINTEAHVAAITMKIILFATNTTEIT